ncbi:MAG: hypothetical protein R3D55_25115 [Chloroflexota bacterium]
MPDAPAQHSPANLSLADAPQSADQIVFARPDAPEFGLSPVCDQRRPLPHTTSGMAPTGATGSTTARWTRKRSSTCSMMDASYNFWATV